MNKDWSEMSEQTIWRSGDWLSQTYSLTCAKVWRKECACNALNSGLGSDRRASQGGDFAFTLKGIGLPWWLRGKEFAWSPGDTRDVRSIPWVRKIPRRRTWQPTPVFLPGESHGQRSLVCHGRWGRRGSDTTEAPEWIRKPLMAYRQGLTSSVFHFNKIVLAAGLRRCCRLGPAGSVVSKWSDSKYAESWAKKIYWSKEKS